MFEYSIIFDSVYRVLAMFASSLYFSVSPLYVKVWFYLCRLEKFAEDIENEYKQFDSWRERCDNMNQWLSESEKLIKSEEKIGTDIEVIKEQITDNQVRT